MKRPTDDELIEELKLRFKENKESMTELSMLMEELKEVNKKLAESEALKSHFISNITNEIVNPFTSILGLSKSILSIQSDDWDKVRQMASLIHYEAFNLDFQLKNIFAAAEIEAGEVMPQILKVDIPQLIKTLIESFVHIAEKKQISIIFNDDINKKEHSNIFMTDPEKIQLMLSNLLDNAIKYSSAANKVEVNSIIKDKILNITVTDYGIGISEENQKIIFDRFKRLDTGVNSLNRGHGLGLSINKAFIELLNGKIEVKSQKFKGSKFTIIIPESESEVGDFAPDGNEIFFGDSVIL